MFVIRCRYLVEHDDRAIEINKTQRCIEATLRELYGIPMELGAMSCEMLARELIKHDAFGNPVWKTGNQNNQRARDGRCPPLEIDMAKHP